MERGARIRQHLFGLVARGIKYDLDRMRHAADRCKNPQNAYPCFHVAGTNGKGSACAFLESAVRNCGAKTGLFTSPHLVRFEERFMVNGRPIADTVWLAVYDDLRGIIEESRLTFFEATTLLAFEIFRREKVDWAVFETGLGGRLDATNLVTPRVSLITRIAMDHRELLGDDLASIAGEKLGIVKPAVPLVMARPDAAEVTDRAVRRCEAMESSLTFIDESNALEPAIDAEGATFYRDGRRYRINLRGGYQLVNALLALRALEIAGFGDSARIAAGLERTRLPGRYQIETVGNRTVVFDVGHNPDASEAFCTAIDGTFGGATICFVIGIMKDKDIGRMMPEYARITRELILTAPSTERAARPEDLQRAIPDDFKGSVTIRHSVAEAVATAFESDCGVIGVAGSFFTVGEAMQHLKIDPYGGGDEV